MKLYLSLILFLVSYVCLIKSTRYANFVPFSNSNCNYKPYGIGFSLPIVGSCTSGGPFTSSPISWEMKTMIGHLGSFEILVVKQYNNNNCSGFNYSTNYFPNDTCTPDTANFQQFNGKITNFPSTMYTLVYISNEPYHAPNSIVSSYYSNGTNCNENSLLFSTSISNGLNIDYQDESHSTKLCRWEIPTSIDCSSNGNCQPKNLYKQCSNDNSKVFCT